MKLLAVFLLVGIALTSAVPVPSSELSLSEVEELEFFLNDFALEAEDGDEESELVKKLRERFEEALNKVKDAINNGRSVKEETLKKLKESFDKLKQMNKKASEKAKELLNNLRNKLGNYFQKIVDRITGKGNEERKRSTKDQVREQLEANFERLMNLVKDQLEKGKEVSNYLKTGLKNLFKQMGNFASEVEKKVRDMAKKFPDHIREKFEDFCEQIGLKMKEEKRSVKEVYERVKNYFKDLKINLKERLVKFGEWAKDKYEKGLEKGKSELENVKKLAHEFIHDVKDIGKDVAEQAKEFFREYKEDLGTAYDEIREKVREILKKN